MFKNIERDFEGIRSSQIIVGVITFAFSLSLYFATKFLDMSKLGNGMFLFGSAFFMFISMGIFLEQLYL
tara:strand:- start:739 stop:945 length:207 start_codon:yes stop_codon:yes gene_type:complete